MSDFGTQESHNFWSECIRNESLCSLIVDPRIRMVACRDYVINKLSETEGDLSLDDLQNYESDIPANLNLK